MDPFELIKNATGIDVQAGIKKSQQAGHSPAQTQSYLAEAVQKKVTQKIQQDTTKKQEPSTLKKIGQKFGGFQSEALAETSSELGNIAKLTDYINPASYAEKIARKMGFAPTPTLGEGFQKAGQYGAESVRDVGKQAGVDPSGVPGILGRILGTVGAQVPALAFGGSALKGTSALAPISEASTKVSSLTSILSKAAKPASFLTKSGGTTAVAIGSQTGELPSGKELGAYGMLDLGLSGLASLGSSIYRSAFKLPPKQAEQLLTRYGTTAGQVAEEKGFMGSASSINKKFQAEAKDVWNQLMNKAKKGMPVSKEEFLTIKDKLKTPLKNLPQSEYKKNAEQMIDKIVEQFAPAKKITSEEIIETIKQVNKDLFKGGDKVVLSNTQIQSLESLFKRELKRLLPAGSEHLYTEYAKNKLVSKIMESKAAKEIIGGSVLGGFIGGTQGDSWPDRIMNALVWGVGGIIAGKAIGSTTAKTITGQTLKQSEGLLPSTTLKSIIDRATNN